MSCQVEKHKRSLSDERAQAPIIQLLKKCKLTKEDLHMLVEYASLNDIPIDERRKEAEKPLYLARYE